MTGEGRGTVRDLSVARPTVTGMTLRHRARRTALLRSFRHVPTDHRLDYCTCGASWPCPAADQPRAPWGRPAGPATT